MYVKQDLQTLNCVYRVLSILCIIREYSSFSAGRVSWIGQYVMTYCNVPEDAEVSEVKFCRIVHELLILNFSTLNTFLYWSYTLYGKYSWLMRILSRKN